MDGLLLGVILVPLFLVLAPSGDERGVTVITSLAGFVYFVVLDARGGTLGKRLLRMRVVDATGNRPGFGASSIRNLWLLTTLLPTIVGQFIALTVIVVIAMTIARDPDDVGIHDRYAATFVRVVTRAAHRS